MARLDETVGTADYNDIFAGPRAGRPSDNRQAPPPHMACSSAAPSSTGTPGGEFSACSATATGDTTGYILAEDTDTGTDDAVMAHVYKTGYFRREALKTDGSYTLTDVDYDKLRGIGIITTDSL